MNTLARSLAVGIAAATLAACGGTPNRGIESVHQPVVSRADYAFDVTADAGGLAPGEVERLAGWLDTLDVRYGDRIAVDDPTGGYYAAREDVAAAAAPRGLLLAAAAPVTPGAVTPGTVRVVVSRMTASVPRCPDRSRLYQPNYDAHTSSDYGCAVNSNLAGMVANPADLVRGQAGEGTADVRVGTKAIDTFRRAQPTGAAGLRADSAGGGGAGGGGGGR